MKPNKLSLPEAQYRTVFEAAYEAGKRILDNCRILIDVIGGNTTEDGWTQTELARYWKEHSPNDTTNRSSYQ